MVKVKVSGTLDMEFPENSLVEEARKQLKQASIKEDADTKEGIKKAGTIDGNKYIPQLNPKQKLPI